MILRVFWHENVARFLAARPPGYHEVMVELTLVAGEPLPPAPGAAGHVSLELANSVVTVPIQGTVDLLNSPAAATRWLVDHRLAPPDAELQDYCAGLLTSLRNQTRDVLEAATHHRAPAEASLVAINKVLRGSPTHQLGWDPALGFRTQIIHPTTRIVEHALGVIAADLTDLVTGPEKLLIAACGAESCDRFMLRTHARRHWCSKRCGDRVRAARAYARRSHQAG